MSDRYGDKASHLADMVESLDDAVITTDVDGTITSWNAAAERIFGYPYGEALGQSITTTVPDDRLDEAQHLSARVRMGEVVSGFDTMRKRKNGNQVAVSLTLTPMRIPTGAVIGMTQIARDLTERGHTEIALRRLAAIVQFSDDAIVSKNIDGTVTSWNRAAEEMFGYSAEEMIGKSIRLLIPADRQSEEDDVIAHIVRGDRVEHFETIRQRKDGSMVPISLTVSPIRDSEGRVVGASKIARNISDRKQAEEERARLYAGLQEADRVKDEFLATLSHELRTPLNAILGYARMIQAGLLSGDKQARAVETIERNASSLNQIVEDVLDVSRIISGKLRLNMQSVELEQVIRSALDTVLPAADARGVQIDLVVEPDAPPISGDPERLHQIIWNIASNAVKFTPRGGSVHLRLGRVHSHLELEISDTGIGIPPSFLPHIFERFRQADAGTTRERGGLGLGLAITRHLVELHGGTIKAASAGPGKGSTFCIAFPVMVVRPSGYSVGRAPLQDRRSEPRVSVPNLRGLRVLVVDDDRDALRLVREILEATGADVATANSATDALEVLERVRPDVLISDISMPRMDGFQLLACVRQLADAALRDVPAVALTAYARSEDRAKALRSGFQSHLAKPIDPANLMAAIAALASKTTLNQRT